MTNEQYLIASYFVVGIISLGVALTAYLCLHRSFAGIIGAVHNSHFFQILWKLFLIGIVFPVLFGFFSVSFRSCSKNTYEKIIADRAYLVAKNQEQISTSLFYIAIALLIWGFIALLTLFVIKRHRYSMAKFDIKT